MRAVRRRPRWLPEPGRTFLNVPSEGWLGSAAAWDAGRGPWSVVDEGSEVTSQARQWGLGSRL